MLGDKNGDGWKVGIQSPYGNSIIKAVSASNTSVVTSGVYQRYFEFENKRYHHIISPHTLYPSESYLSVTVVYDNSGWADALSTALFNMPVDEGKELLREFDGIGVMWIKADGKIEYYGNIE